MRGVRALSPALLLSVAVLAPAACASAHKPASSGSGTSAAAAGAGCLRSGGRTLAADRSARVFSMRGYVYACVNATGRSVRLGGAGFCNRPAARVAPVGLAGNVVAYGLQTCGVDTAQSAVVVRDLGSDRRLADLPASTLPLRPESFVSVRSLVLRSDGSVGWIAAVDSIVGGAHTSYEVHRFSGGAGALLDAGASIDPSSLRLAGGRLSGRLTWRDGSVVRSSPLG
jgi:hypothetical protein